MKYKIAEGHDIALLSLVNLVPQPHSPGIQVTRRTYGGDGSIYDEGLYVPLEFNVLQGATMYQALLAQFGLDDARFANVTVYCRNDLFQWVRMNGTAIRPEIGRDGQWDNFFPRRFIIIIRDLELSV